MGGNASSARHRRARRQAPEPTLTDLDLRVLGLLSSQRVLTQTQLAALLAETPARTLRYRCNRLAKVGRSAAPAPTANGARRHITSGRPAGARRWPAVGRRHGEASGVSPTRSFLAHAAGLSEIYVALGGTLPRPGGRSAGSVHHLGDPQGTGDRSRRLH
jgi:hypothetical protein